MPSRKRIITVLIADDHPGWIEGVRSIISNAPDMQVVGEAEKGDQIRQKVAELRPDILLLDLAMPHHNPIEFEKWVRENYPETITLVLTAHDRDAYLAGMMIAGAAGYLDKKMKANDRLAAIRRAARGEFLFDKEQMERDWTNPPRSMDRFHVTVWTTYIGCDYNIQYSTYIRYENLEHYNVTYQWDTMARTKTSCPSGTRRLHNYVQHWWQDSGKPGDGGTINQAVAQ